MKHLTHVQALLNADARRWQILQQVRDLRLPDCWVAAGFIRSAVWDHLHGHVPSPLPTDIDVIWLDSDNRLPEQDIELETKLLSVDNTLN